MLKKIEEFVVIGGGLMGAGIAQVSMFFTKNNPDIKQFNIILLDRSIIFYLS